MHPFLVNIKLIFNIEQLVWFSKQCSKKELSQVHTNLPIKPTEYNYDLLSTLYLDQEEMLEEGRVTAVYVNNNYQAT